MNINVGKTIRLGDLFDPTDHSSLIIDTSITASLGAVSGLENIKKTVSKINTICDGIIVNPGQLEHHADLLGGARRAAPIVRLDWTNYTRDESFCLPAVDIHRVLISGVEDALRLGASAVLMRYLMGFDDEFEAENVQSVSLQAKDAYRESLPFIVEICPLGPKVDTHNYDGTLKLGVACMLEAGADVLILPDCSPELLREIANWSDIPVIIRIKNSKDSDKVKQKMITGISGVLISEELFDDMEYQETLRQIQKIVHPKTEN